MKNNEAIAEMLKVVGRLPARMQSLRMSEGCVLAEDLCSPIDIPSAATVTRDGYAVRSDDARSGRTLPVHLPSAAGSPGSNVPAVPARTACRVLTGSLLPAGADAVVTQERVRLVPQPGGDSIEIIGDIRTGQHVVAAGAELARGARAIAAGTPMGPPELALVAAMGLQQIPVVPRPRVAVIVTGSELRQPLQASNEGLRASNTVLVEAMVRTCGGVVGSTEIVSDDPEALRGAFDRALDCDVIFTTGGTGRGSADLVRGVLQDREAYSMWDRSSRGSRPVSFRMLRTARGPDIPHLALPGRPVAAVVAFTLFGLPLLRRLAGYAELPPRYCLATFADAVSTTQRFVPVKLERREDGVWAKAKSNFSLYGLCAAIDADGFALMPRPGEECSRNTVRVLLPPWAGRDRRLMDEQRTGECNSSLDEATASRAAIEKGTPCGAATVEHC